MTETSPAPLRPHFRFFDRLRVRWSEVDMQKIVFNGHYLMYFDTAVAAYWRALALPYHDTMHALQGDLYVRKATLEYEASARYDDACDVGLRCVRIGNSSMVFQAAVFRGEQRLVHGELIYVFADPATQTSRPVPAALRAVLLAFEAGEPMLKMEIGGWHTLGAEASAVRRQVWAEELALPEAAVVDADDDRSLHWIARNRLGVPVGTARLVPGESGTAQLGRMSVLHAVRGAGVGRAMLASLLAHARQQGLAELRLQAQRHATAFYARAGFVADEVEPMWLAGLLHVPMQLRLG